MPAESDLHCTSPLPTERPVKLFLASASPRRAELLRTLDLSFEIMVSEIEEDLSQPCTESELVINLSLAKAKAVADKVRSQEKVASVNQPVPLILAADTIVVLDGDILGKPTSIEDSQLTLKRLSGRRHQVFTGVALTGIDSSPALSGYEVSNVYFREISRAEIDFYCHTDEPVDKAGSYALQGMASAFVEKIEGCFTNVIGLPVPLTVRMLRRRGVAVLGSSD